MAATAGKGVLVFSDGTFFEGELFGSKPAAASEAIGEAVFQTAMSGYQEILTDPSYRGQIVCFTYPSFGNYGINPEDFESSRAWLSGVVVRDLCEIPSNFRSEKTVDAFLVEQKVSGITGVDTRAVVRKIREGGAQTAGIFAATADPKTLAGRVKAQPSMEGLNLVRDFDGTAANAFVTRYLKQKHLESQNLKPIAVLDFGIKYNILRELIEQGFHPHVFAGDTPLAAQKNFKASDYVGYFFSNGPGDPAVVTHGIQNIRDLVDTGKPSLGICLGHQMLALALGAKTYKLKFGHHGGNQPVKADYRRQVIITSQNHGFAVDEESLRATAGAAAAKFEINANDLSAEGFRIVSPAYKILSVQYHPEAAPGPRDAAVVFSEFKSLFN